MKTLVLIFIFCLSLNAQPILNTQIPQPKQVLGYELGEKFTPHSLIEKYISVLQTAAKDRIRVFPYGETYEGRTLYLVVVSSPENLNRLEEIKANIQKLSDPRSIDDQEANKIIKSNPAIAWLSYGVHGNEASASEAGLDVLYQLAARTDEEVMMLLKNLVIVIDPLLNPDGHERYVNFQTTHTGKKLVEDRTAVEHSEDWPGGRSNHYYFDLNRDWAWLTQIETQVRIKVYQEWKPQVHADFHEMGYNSSYFFFPSFKPVNKNIPKNTVEWGEIYGRANAAAFDTKGWSYWSGEVFDLFYPGFGDSWPSLNGAIGMTYEQAGGVGVRVKRSDESILTLKDRMEHHSTTSFATLRATAENREKRLHDFYQFFKDAINEGRTGALKAYIVNPSKDPAQAAKMVDLLMRQGVEVMKTQEETTLGGLSTYFTKGVITKKIPSGSYIISLEQPAKRLITSLMEEEPELADTFFYDISTWALPVAFGVETYWTGKPVTVSTTKVVNAEGPKGTVIGGKAVYAYVFRWNSNNAVRGLVWLLQNNYKVHAAMKDFTMSGEKFSRGSIIIPIGGNPSNIHEKINEIAQTYSLTIYSAQSGYTDHGMDLGSDRAVRLKKPKIIVVTDSPVSSESYGAIWSMFDNNYGVDFIPVKLDRLGWMDMHDYTAIIFPDDWSGGQGYKSQLDSNVVQKIKTWIAGGGTFIGIEGGAAFASASVGKIAGVKIKEKKKSDEKKDQKPDDKKVDKKDDKPSEEELEKLMTVEERVRKNRLENIPGTMLKVKLDNSHPLGFGYDSIITVLKTSNTMYELSPKGFNVGIYTKSPRLSGYLSKENEKLLGETPSIVHEQLGAGNIVLFADDPNFRMFWDNLNRVFFNSVLLLPSIRNVTIGAEGQ
jgi:hypothetical protein